MNNQSKFSIRAAAHQVLVALRVKLNLKPGYTMAEIAQAAGLPVVNLENRPANFEGYLDRHDAPRFIAVNPDLPAHQLAWFTARQIAYCAQKQRCNSLALNQPWKWEMLDAAPDDLKNKILALDAEYRAHWLMMAFSTGDEFRAFVRENPKRYWSHAFTPNVVAYHLSKLRIKAWLDSFFRKIAVVAFPIS